MRSHSGYLCPLKHLLVLKDSHVLVPGLALAYRKVWQTSQISYQILSRWQWLWVLWLWVLCLRWSAKLELFSVSVSGHHQPNHTCIVLIGLAMLHGMLLPSPIRRCHVFHDSTLRRIFHITDLDILWDNEVVPHMQELTEVMSVCLLIEIVD